MNVNQNYALLNNALREVLGDSAITVRNVKDLADAGTLLENFTNGFELFNRAINDVMIKTEIDTMLFELTGIPFLSDTHEYGGFIREIYIGMPEAEQNTSWNVGDNDYTPSYMPVKKLPVSVKIYSNKGTHQFEYTIPDDLLKSAFHSAEELDAYITGVGVAVENAISLDAIEISRLVRCNFIARKALAENSVTAVNLLSKFKEVYEDSTLDEDTCIYDKTFLRFAAELMSRYPKKLAKPTTLYSDELTADEDHYVRQTTKEHLIFEIVEDFASKVKYNLQSDVYHKELVELPKYNEIDFWQGAGTGDDYADHTSIKVDLGTVATPNVVQLSGVVALAYDDRAIRMIYNDPHTVSERNNRDEYTNFISKANYGYAIKLSHNAVVFYIADNDWSFSGGITVDVASPNATIDGMSVATLTASAYSSIFGGSIQSCRKLDGTSGAIANIVGGIPYVTGYTGYSEDASEQSGAYLPLHIVSVNPDAEITVSWNDGDDEGTPDNNGNIALRFESDYTDQTIVITEDMGTRTNTYRVNMYANANGSLTGVSIDENTLTSGTLPTTFGYGENVTLANLYGVSGITIDDTASMENISATFEDAYLVEVEDTKFAGIVVKPTLSGVEGMSVYAYDPASEEWTYMEAEYGEIETMEDIEDAVSVLIPQDSTDATSLAYTKIIFIASDGCTSTPQYDLTEFAISD